MLIGDRRCAVVRPCGVLPSHIEYVVVSHVAVDSRRQGLCLSAGFPVVVFDPAGGYLRSWGSGLIVDPHGVFISPNDQVMVVDRDSHQVMGFDTAGTLRFSLGERGNHFHEQTHA